MFSTRLDLMGLNANLNLKRTTEPANWTRLLDEVWLLRLLLLQIHSFAFNKLLCSVYSRKICNVKHNHVHMIWKGVMFIENIIWLISFVFCPTQMLWIYYFANRFCVCNNAKSLLCKNTSIYQTAVVSFSWNVISKKLLAVNVKLVFIENINKTM